MASCLVAMHNTQNLVASGLFFCGCALKDATLLNRTKNKNYHTDREVELRKRGQQALKL